MQRLQIRADFSRTPHANPPAASLSPLTIGQLIERLLAAGDLRPSTQTEWQRVARRNLPPVWDWPAEGTTRKQVALFLSGIDRPAIANTCHALLSAAYGRAIRAGLLDCGNPLQGLAKRKLKTRERVLTDAEIRAVWHGVSGMHDFGRIVRLLLLTGCRCEEIGGLRWEEVRLKDHRLELPASRCKNGRAHIVPLTPLAESLLPEWRGTAWPHVFGRIQGRGFNGMSSCKVLLDQRLAGMAPWMLHDLRRTFVTHMNEKELAEPWIVEALVNHVSGHKAGVAGRYNRASYVVQKWAALERWAAEVQRIVGN